MLFGVYVEALRVECTVNVVISIPQVSHWVQMNQKPKGIDVALALLIFELYRCRKYMFSETKLIYFETTVYNTVSKAYNLRLL